MRRDWLNVLLFALALAIQAFSPAAANVAVAKGAGDSRASIELCLKVAAGDQQQIPGQTHQLHRDACLFCQAACDGVAPFAARLVSHGMAPVQWTALVWMVADRALPTAHHDYSRQARAPPTFF